VQQRRVGRALVERQEHDVSDAGEPLQGASHLPAGVYPEGPRADLVHDHDHGRGRREAAQLRVIAEEPADAQGIRRGDRDDQIRLAEGRRRRGMTSGAGQIVGHLVVGVEGGRHVDDGVLGPLPTRSQRGAQAC